MKTVELWLLLECPGWPDDAARCSSRSGRLALRRARNHRRYSPPVRLQHANVLRLPALRARVTQGPQPLPADHGRFAHQRLQSVADAHREALLLRRARLLAAGLLRAAPAGGATGRPPYGAALRGLAARGTAGQCRARQSAAGQARHPRRPRRAAALRQGRTLRRAERGTAGGRHRRLGSLQGARVRLYAV